MKTNKCLSDSEIQLILDSEVSSETRHEIQKHLAECGHCSTRVAEQKRWIEFVNSSMRGEAVDKEIQIPSFNKGLPFTESKFIKINFYSVLKIAAVFAVMLCVYLIAEKEETQAYKPTAQELLLWEETMLGDDANYVWHDRTISAMETNAKGEVITIEIN